jgi:hypothetical protein
MIQAELADDRTDGICIKQETIWFYECHVLAERN